MFSYEVRVFSTLESEYFATIITSVYA